MDVFHSWVKNAKNLYEKFWSQACQASSTKISFTRHQGNFFNWFYKRKSRVWPKFIMMLIVVSKLLTFFIFGLKMLKICMENFRSHSCQASSTKILFTRHQGNFFNRFYKWKSRVWPKFIMMLIVVSKLLTFFIFELKMPKICMKNFDLKLVRRLAQKFHSHVTKEIFFTDSINENLECDQSLSWCS